MIWKDHIYKFCKKKLVLLHKKLPSVLNCIDFAHICSLCLSVSDSSIKNHEEIQENKFNKLLKERQPRQDPEKVIFNYFNISLSDVEKSLLVKRLDFSIPPKKLNNADYLVNFEIFYRSIYNLDIMLNGNLDFVKTKIKDAALISFCDYNANLPRNLLNEEFKALQNLSKNTFSDTKIRQSEFSSYSW